MGEAFADLSTAIATAPAPPGVNTPDLTDNLKSDREAISSLNQAFSVCDTLLYNNRDRIAQQAQIQQKVDAILPPFNNQRLAEQGKLWSSNVMFGFLQTVAGKVSPRLVNKVKNAPTVTASAFDASVNDGPEKTNIFQGIVTTTWRQWQQNSSFTQGLAHEASVYGRVLVGFDDPWSFEPLVFRTDKAFVPEGLEVGVKDCQVFAAQRSYYINELFDRIEDKKSAQVAGWDIEATVDAINKAAPVPAARPGDITLARTYEDLLREVVMGYSWMQGANVINCWILIVTEHDGSITQRILCRDNTTELFYANYKDQTMDEWVLPWVFQYGNGRFYGSFGVGQLIYDLSVQIEKTRNEVVNNFHKRNRIFVRVPDAKDLNKAKLIIQDDVIYVAGGEVVGNVAAYPALTEEFMALDRYFTTLAEQKVGAFLPEQAVAPGARPTATQAKINALKESETSTFVMDEFITHWLRLMWMVQRRLFRKDNPNPIAKAARAKMLAACTEEELQAVLDAHPVQVTIDYSEAKQEQMVEALTQIIASGDPDFNQYEAKRQLATIRLGAAAAAALMIPQQDNTILIEAQRQQQEEVDFFQTSGNQISVSPRDNHKISMAYLKGQPDPQSGSLNGPLPKALQTAATAMQIVHQNPDQATEAQELPIAQKFIKLATLMFNHYIQHFDFAVKYKQLGLAENDEKAFIASTGKLLQTVTNSLAQAMTPPQPQPGTPGQPPAAQPNVTPFTLPNPVGIGQTAGAQ